MTTLPAITPPAVHADAPLVAFTKAAFNEFHHAAYVLKVHADYDGTPSEVVDDVFFLPNHKILMFERDPERRTTKKWVNVNANFHDISVEHPGIYQEFESIGYPKGSVWGVISDSNPGTSMMTFRLEDEKSPSEITVLTLDARTPAAGLSGDMFRVVDAKTGKFQLRIDDVEQKNVPEEQKMRTHLVLAEVFKIPVSPPKPATPVKP